MSGDQFVSFVNLPVPVNAVTSALDAAGLELPDALGAPPPHMVLMVCGQDANADSKLVLDAWMTVLGTLPPEAFEIEILGQFAFRGREGNTMAVRANLTHLLETAIDAARVEAHRRVDTLVLSQEAFEPWILLCEGGVMPDPKTLPPSFGLFRAGALHISCPAKTFGADGRLLAHTTLEEAELPS